MDELSVIADMAQRAAARGGRILMDLFRREQQVWSKSPFEIVTEADLASEKALIEEIRCHYPKHTIVTEEQGTITGNVNHVWIVDPLDGTQKYVLGEPYFSISIAYACRGIVEVAVVHNPYTDETYSACRGKGASRNGVMLKVSAVDDLAETFACCDWGGSPAMQHQGLCYLSRLLPPTTLGVGVNFSPALDLCNLAMGNISAMISNGTTPEDHSAGALIVTESGGIVTNFGCTGWSARDRGIVATSNAGIAHQVTQVVNECSS